MKKKFLIYLATGIVALSMVEVNRLTSQSVDISNTALDNIEALSQTDITSVSFDCGGSVMVSTCSIYCPACGGRITRLNHHGPATNINGRCLCGHGFSL